MSFYFNSVKYWGSSTDRNACIHNNSIILDLEMHSASTLYTHGVYYCCKVQHCFGFVGQEEHVTNSQDPYRIFPLKKTIVSTSELSFSVRAVISASVTYYTAPTRQTPRLVVKSRFILKITQ